MVPAITLFSRGQTVAFPLFRRLTAELASPLRLHPCFTCVPLPAVAVAAAAAVCRLLLPAARIICPGVTSAASRCLPLPLLLLLRITGCCCQPRWIMPVSLLLRPAAAALAYDYPRLLLPAALDHASAVNLRFGGPDGAFPILSILLPGTFFLYILPLSVSLFSLSISLCLTYVHIHTVYSIFFILFSLSPSLFSPSVQILLLACPICFFACFKRPCHVCLYLSLCLCPCLPPSLSLLLLAFVLLKVFCASV